MTIESSPGLAPYPSTHLPAAFGPSGQREKRLQSNLSIRTADAVGPTENRIYWGASANTLHLPQARFCLKCLRGILYVLYCMCRFFTMILADWEPVWCSSQVQWIVFCLPYDTPCVVPMQQNHSKNTKHDSCKLRTINNTQYMQILINSPLNQNYVHHFWWKTDSAMYVRTYIPPSAVQRLHIDGLSFMGLLLLCFWCLHCWDKVWWHIDGPWVRDFVVQSHFQATVPLLEAGSNFCSVCKELVLPA